MADLAIQILCFITRAPSVDVASLLCHASYSVIKNTHLMYSTQRFSKSLQQLVCEQLCYEALNTGSCIFQCKKCKLTNSKITSFPPDSCLPNWQWNAENCVIYCIFFLHRLYVNAEYTVTPQKKHLSFLRPAQELHSYRLLWRYGLIIVYRAH